MTEIPATALRPACPDCGSTYVARVRSNRTGRDYLAEFDRGEPAPWKPHFRNCHPAERAAVLDLFAHIGLLKAIEVTDNLTQFPRANVTAELLRLREENILDTDGKRFWRTGQEAPAVPVTVTRTAPLEPGYYVLAGSVYKVQQSRGSEKRYAKKLNGEGRFDYAPGAIRDLRPEHRLTLEQARAWGKINGRCMICAAELTNPESIEYGIGPVCRKRI